MSSEIQSYRDLKVWQAAIELSVLVYDLTKGFPPSEAYGLTSQMRRSSVSVASNIAEGYGRQSKGSFVQFLRIAQGSLKELETQVIIASRVGFMAEEHMNRLLETCEEIGKMLLGLIRSVKRRQTEGKS